MDRKEPTFGAPQRRAAAQQVSDAAPPRLRPLRQSEAPEPDRSAWSRAGATLLYAGLFLVCVAAALATFIMVAAPTDLVRDQIVAQVKARTGRTLTLNGSTSFTFFPSLGVRLSEVSLSAPPGMDGPPLMTARQIAADIRLIPLLEREVVIERLVLSAPHFELVVDAEGRRSWDFAAAADPGPMRLAQATQRGSRTDTLPPELSDFVRNASDPAKAGERASQGLKGLKGLDELVIADTRIDGGTLRYTDVRSGLRHELRGIDTEVSLKSLASPLELKGKFEWQGEALKVDAKLGTLKAAMEGRPARLTASISGRPMDGSYEGALTSRSAIELDGRLSIRTESARQLAAWLGRPLPPSEGFGSASLAAIVKTAATATTLDAAVISLDGATSNGTLTLDTAGPRPLLKANLRVSELDLRKYRDTRSPEERAVRAPSPPQLSAPSPLSGPLPRTPGSPGAPRSIEDLLQREGAGGPQVRGFSQREGWSDEPIDLAALSTTDVEARLSFGRISAGDLKLGQTQTQVALKAGALRLTIDDAQLYEGRARGFVTLDVTRSNALGANIQVEGIAAQPLLKDAAGFDAVAGKGRLSLALAGQGRSEKEIVETLAGKAELTVSDGALVGWNIPQMIRGLGKGRFNGFDRVPTEKTDFSELAASFDIASGIATNKDMRILGPLVRMTGAGTVELPGRRIDYTVKPRIVASLSGQGAAPAEGAGIEIPVRIRGAWDRPSYEPDLQSVLKDPDKIADTVNEIGKQLGVKGNLGDTVRRLLGGGKQ
jgi:AsmA protein